MIATATPIDINGVALYTKSGRPRQRFSQGERLRMLGCTSEQFENFYQFFVCRYDRHLIRRVQDGSDQGWRTSHHRLRLADLANHLLGNRLPGREVRWVGSFGDHQTNWAAIDVDFQGDEEEFRRRCDYVERQLRALGVYRQNLLILPTPSGGRHYYFFFYHQVPTNLLRTMLELVGIEHQLGVYEVYPDPQRGFRLPFGHVNGSPINDNDWLTFWRQLHDGTFPRVNPKTCWERAEEYHRRHPDNPEPALGETSRSSTPSPRCIGIPKREVSQRATSNSPPGSFTVGSAAQVKEHIRLGIREPGTRVALTMQVAWHVVNVMRLATGEAEDYCVRWTYRTGRFTSKDVQADLARGTRRVEEQTRRIVRWMVEARKASGQLPTRPLLRYSEVELDALAAILLKLPATERIELGYFVLEMLRFAKDNGCSGERGWSCSASIKGIVRRWPGCSGKRYKPKLDALLDGGPIEIIREKRQSANGTGRARTYLIKVPVTADQFTMTFDAAKHYLAQRLIQKASTADSHASNQSDTYVCLSPSGGEGTSENQNPALQNQSRSHTIVVAETERAMRMPATASDQSDYWADDTGRSEHDIRKHADLAIVRGTGTNAEPAAHGGDRFRGTELARLPWTSQQRAGYLKHRRGGEQPYDLHSAPPLPRPRPAGSPYSQRPGRSLVARQKELLAKPNFIPRLRDPAPGQQSSLAPYAIALKYLQAEAAAIKSGHSGPTDQELQALPRQHDREAIDLVLAARRRGIHSRGWEILEVLHLLETTQRLLHAAQLPYERWLLFADPERLDVGESYERAKLIRDFAGDIDSAHPVDVYAVGKWRPINALA